MRILQMIVLLTGLTLLMGCGSQNKIVTKYYVIAAPDSMEYVINRKLPILEGYCEIAPVKVYPAYDSQKIVSKSNSHEIVYYRYHQWAQRPDEAFFLMLEVYFSNTSVFKGVSSRYWRIDPAYKLMASVRQLEIIQENKHVSAHLSVEFKLVSNETKELLITHQANRFKPLKKNDLNLFTKAIGELFYDELNVFSEAIVKQVSDDNQ